MSLRVETSPQTYQSPTSCQDLQTCWDQFCKAVTDLFWRIVAWFKSLCCPNEPQAHEYTVGPVGCRVTDRTGGAARVIYGRFLRDNQFPDGAHRYRVHIGDHFLCPASESHYPTGMLSALERESRLAHTRSTHFTLERDPEQPHLLKITEKDDMNVGSTIFVDTRHLIDDAYFISSEYRPQPLDQTAAEERVMALFLDAPERHYRFAAFSPEHGEVAALDSGNWLHLARPGQSQMSVPENVSVMGTENRTMLTWSSFLLQFDSSDSLPVIRNVFFNRLPATLLDQESIIVKLRARLVTHINAAETGLPAVLIDLVVTYLTPLAAQQNTPLLQLQ